ncbi:MAG: MotA/TolQ/ExbB proton channel family protein [Pseudomonadota bacterium]|nr:MotA/TolQ/ExbB proton channel family protein [Pseudomonadota bacterium]
MAESLTPKPRRVPLAKSYDAHRLSSPRVFLLSMVIFLIIVGFVAATLYRQISAAFVTNPGLNGLIIFVLAIGILLALMQVIRLMPEVSWVNNFRKGDLDLDQGRDPVLLAPMKGLVGQSGRDMALTTGSMRSILDSIATRLDESRELSRYLIGLLVFLGLLGTFWGLLQTIGSIGDTIQSLDPRSGDANDVLDALKSGLRSPLDGMGTAFSSSLFGLSGSLVLGFLDLQAGRAQNRFYTELENWLSSVTDMNVEFAAASGAVGGTADEIRAHLEQITANLQGGGGGSNQRATAAMATLAEGIQGLVQHLRNDQQIMREQLARQEEQQKQMSALLKRVNQFFDRASKG